MQTNTTIMDAMNSYLDNKQGKDVVNVKFLMDDPNSGTINDVFAFFPDQQYHNADTGHFMCYSHIGQHSACHTSYAKSCKEATQEQYAILKAELESIGYNLNVLNK